MKVFFSWSGERSKYIAETLSNWLEQVLQAVDPWVSSDIEKGKRWDDAIAKKLEETKVSIICLTRDNLDSTWVHFEAGAISKTGDGYVCTFLFDITPANVKEPLSLFQATQYNKDDVLKLLKTINNLLSNFGFKSLKESNLEEVFVTYWPKLEEKLKLTPKSSAHQKEIRSDRELLEESLQILRSLKENSPTSVTAQPINDFRYEQIKKLWPLFEETTKQPLDEFISSQNFMEFRRFMIQHGVSIPPPLIRNYLQKLSKEFSG